VALWVITLLSILVSAFAFDMHLEAILTSYCRKRLKAEYLARAGIELVKVIDSQSRSIKGNAEQDSDVSAGPFYSYAVALKNGGAVSLKEKLGEGLVLVDITPEPGRRNVNKLDKLDWEGVLEVGEIPEERWPELIDCILDWIDNEAPEITRSFGAESDDYYLRQDPPYRARNGEIDTIEELLRVKSFTNEVVFGGVLNKDDPEPQSVSGIADLLTTYGDGKVNVNAASKRILMTLPGIDDLLADEIVAQREGLTEQGGITEDRHFKDIPDFFSRVPGLNRLELEPKLTTSSAIYRINSAGNVHGVRRTISCIVEFKGGGMTILRWVEKEG
jgi:general secretion pathway protein K